MNKIAKNLLLSLAIAAPVALSVSAVKAEAAVLGNTPTGTEVSANTSHLGHYTVAYVHHHRRHHRRPIRWHHR